MRQLDRVIGLLFGTRVRCALWAAATVLLIMLPNLVASLHMPVSEVDEAAVYFSTSYFDVAFVKHDFHSTQWQERDAFDHPPLWKYFYGSVLFAAGRPRGKLADKQEWFQLAWGSKRISSFIDERAPISVLVPLRAAAGVLVLVSLALLFVLIANAIDPLTAFLTVLCAALFPVINVVATRALIDPLLLFLLLLTTWLNARWLRAAQTAHWLAWSSALGFSLALLINTKITGIAATAAVMVSALPQVLQARDRRATGLLMLRAFLVVAGAAGAFAIAINPTWWHAPVRTFWQMVEYRQQQVLLQMRVFGGGHYITARAGLVSFLERMFLTSDPAWRRWHVPLLALATVYGGWRFAKQLDWTSSWTCAVAAHLTLWLAIAAATYRLPWLRYTLTAIPCVAMLIACALAGALRLGEGASTHADA